MQNNTTARQSGAGSDPDRIADLERQLAGLAAELCSQGAMLRRLCGIEAAEPGTDRPQRPARHLHAVGGGQS